MDAPSSKFKVRLGMFIIGGLALFVLAIFIIGKQRNMFNPVFKLTARFRNISGLQVGNNVRFSGINVGTVDNIKIINDTTVGVDLIVKKEVQPFIKTDCEAGIGSEGIVGDRLVTITQGSNGAPMVKDGQQLVSTEPVETDAIISSLKISAGNAEIITEQLAEITIKINNGGGIIGKLIQDSTIAENIDKTIENLKKGSKGLEENMKAARSNFLLRGYFKKKEREAAKLKEEQKNKKEEEEKNKRK
jgi:phospholipid/cholesterol/gamma-HCH transport system substrate-binding protein